MWVSGFSLFALLLAFLSIPAYADSSLNGSVRATYWSSSRDFGTQQNLLTNALWLKAKSTVAEEASVVLDAWAQDSNVLTDGHITSSLREAYVDIHNESINVKVGRQIIPWGRADAINPTDNLTPKDFTRLVVGSNDQREGVASINATYQKNVYSFSVIMLPEFRPDVVPLPTSSGLNFKEMLPSKPVRQWALKIDSSGEDVDWSVSYFDGLDLTPDLRYVDTDMKGINILLEHHRLKVLGADFATTFGPYGLRGEVAYTMTENSNGSDPAIKKPFVFGVIGLERSFLDYLNVNIQYFHRKVFNYQDPTILIDPAARAIAIQQGIQNNQLDRTSNGIAARISYKWLNETLEAEMTTGYSLNRHDYFISPKVNYSINDYWHAYIGADLFRGTNTGNFGRLRDNSTAYVEIRRTF